MGVGGQGERGELRYVCFLFVVVLVFLGGLLFEGTDPSSLPVIGAGYRSSVS